jgi:hypothetical protein
VPVLPSTAALAGVPAFSVDEAVAGLPWDNNWSAARAGVGARAVNKAAIRTTTRPSAARERAAPDGGLLVGALTILCM